VRQFAAESYKKFDFEGKQGIKPIKWIGSQRTQFTHRKNMKRVKTIIEKEKENFVARFEQRQRFKSKFAEAKSLGDSKNRVDKVEEEKDDVEMEALTDESTSVVLVKHASLLSNGLGQAVTLIVPEGHGLGLMRRLVYSGCKAIGEREYLKLMLECNKRVFPHDYPETKSGQELAVAKACEYLKTDYCPKPPSKRLNYQILRQPAPFNPLALFPDWRSAPVSVHPIGRGVPIDNSLLYLPTANDLQLICLEHFTRRANFFDDVPMFHLEEPKGAAAACVKNKQFNVEFAKLTGLEINLSKKQKQMLLGMRDQKIPMGILKEDFSL